MQIIDLPQQVESKFVIGYDFFQIIVHSCSKVMGFFFSMSKSGSEIQCIDLQFCELYYEVFQCGQVKFHNISLACFAAAVVWSE